MLVHGLNTVEVDSMECFQCMHPTCHVVTQGAWF